MKKKYIFSPTTTNFFAKSITEYHTYQIKKKNKQFSVFLRKFPVNMSKACIYNKFQELKFEITSSNLQKYNLIHELSTFFSTQIYCNLPTRCVKCENDYHYSYWLKIKVKLFQSQATILNQNYYLIKLEQKSFLDHHYIRNFCQRLSTSMYMSDYEQIMSLNDLIILAAGR
ncbi:Uncharacterized protein FWK35_00010572, partial [Aphis craccivora]